MKPDKQPDADLGSRVSFPAERGLRKLVEKIRLLESFLCHIPGVIFIHDLTTNHHIWTNGNYMPIIGYEDKEIRQLGLEEARKLFHEEDMATILKGVELLQSRQVDAFSGIYRIRHKIGHWVWMYCSASVIQYDKTGFPLYALGFAADFSPHIRSDQHLNDLISENRRLVNGVRLNVLTRREKEIVAFIARGFSCKEISNKLRLSYLTAETHIKHIHR